MWITAYPAERQEELRADLIRAGPTDPSRVTLSAGDAFRDLILGGSLSLQFEDHVGLTFSGQTRLTRDLPSKAPPAIEKMELRA